MRRLYLLLLAFSITMAGCYPDDFDKASWGPEPELTLSAPGVTLQPAGGSESVTVTTNYEEWTATVDEAGSVWCSVQQAGTTLTVTALANTGEKERTAVISVEVGKSKKEIKEIAVTQLGSEPRIVADPPAVGLPLEGGDASVKITTNLEAWTATVAVGADWCNALREGDCLTVVAGSYSGKQQREALITVRGEGESGSTAVTTVKVIQLGSDPVLNISDPGAFAAEGGRQTLVVMTNLANWEVTVPSTSPWCRADKSGTSLMVQVDANEGLTGRRCELLLTAGSGDGMLKKNIPVVQLGRTPELILSTGSVTFGSGESIQSIAVFTEGTWTAETEAGWCTLLPGDQTLTMYAAKNPSTTEVRRGTVNIRAGNLSQTLEIVQQPDVTLALAVDTLAMETVGGTLAVTVMTNQTAWDVAVPDTVDWCSAVAEGNQLMITVGDNGSAPRETILTVTAGPEEARKSALLLVRQEGIASDRDVLIAFYKATGGDNWTRNDNWCSDRPLSEWYGVTTAMIAPGTKAGEAVERVTELHLGESYGVGNNLTGTIPDVIGQLSELKLLSLGFNQLSGVIPATLGNLTKLTYLELYGNPFTGTLPLEIGNLTKLTFFRVSHARLEGGIPDSYSNLTGLHTFCVQMCGLDGAFPEWIMNCRNLHNLNLSGNAFNGSLPAGLGNLTTLVCLDLRDNQFTGSIPAELGKLVNLKELFLNNNQFTGSIPKELGDLTNLEWLVLSDNQLSGPIPAELGNMTQLKYLHLDGNQLSGSIPPELGNLTNLITLGLQNNNLTGEIPVELGKLVNLDVSNWGYGLHLSGNQFTGSVPPEVQALPNWDRFNPDVNILPQQDGGNLSLEPEVAGEYTVTLRLGGDAAEVDQSKAGTHLYGVQVMARPRGTTDIFTPYGHGIYDDSTRLTLTLSSDREYNILTTLIGEGRTAVQADGNGWAQPLDLVDWQPTGRGVTPLPDYDPSLPSGGSDAFVRDSLRWLGHIDRGATTLASDGATYDRPHLARYAGERLGYTPTADEELEIVMTRVSFVVTCEVDSLREGRIRIEIEGAPYLYIDAAAAEHKVNAAITFANTNGRWTDVSYEETLEVKFVWEKTNGLERELSSERVTFKHNTATRLHTIFKDDGMNMDVENKPLTDGEIIHIEGIIW